MALKRCIRTDSRWNKNMPSRASMEMAEILQPKSSTKRMSDSLIGPRVSSKTGWNIKEAGISSYFETFLAAANSAAALAVVADWWIYESASVDVILAFDARAFPACQEIKVMPSGLQMLPGKRRTVPWKQGLLQKHKRGRWCRWVHGVAGCDLVRACTQKHVDPNALTSCYYYYYIITVVRVTSHWIATKWLEIDQDNLRMKFSALDVDFNSPSPDPLGSRRPVQASVKDSYPP